MIRSIPALAAICFPLAAAEATEMSWSVANGFQVFKKDSDYQKIRQAWQPGKSAQEFLSTQNSKSLRELLNIRDTWWNPGTGSYDEKGLFNQNHNILIRLEGAKPGSLCIWYIDDRRIGEQAPCDVPVTAIGVPENKEFSLSAVVNGAAKQTLEKQSIKAKLILALGDSFASGEGNPDHAAVVATKPIPGSGQADHTSINGLSWFFAGNNANRRFTKSADWWDTTCHRSLLSWQSLYALKTAISDDHTVVRFASFSCSGAEAYDGFFRPQSSPPVNTGQPRIVGTKKSGYVLNLSQLHASVELLCDGVVKPMPQNGYRKEIYGVGNKLYGSYEPYGCSGTMRRPDQILSSFGGNDFAFSKVVMGAIFPERSVKPGTLIDGPIVLVKDAGLKLAAKFAGAVAPERPGKLAVENTKMIYSDLAAIYTGTFAVQPRSVVQMVYPNPLPPALSSECKDRMTYGNEVESEQLRQRSELLKNFIFRIESEKSVSIVDRFIHPFQRAQREAISQLDWNSVEGQEGFEAKPGLRSICATAPACAGTSGVCGTDDLVGWRKPHENLYPSWQPLRNVTEWEAYSAIRMRGMRLLNDTALTQARFVNGILQGDWMRGGFHPTAQVHAGIADAIK